MLNVYSIYLDLSLTNASIHYCIAYNCQLHCKCINGVTIMCRFAQLTLVTKTMTRGRDPGGGAASEGMAGPGAGPTFRQQETDVKGEGRIAGSGAILCARDFRYWLLDRHGCNDRRGFRLGPRCTELWEGSVVSRRDTHTGHYLYRTETYAYNKYF
jgi:hypothetical protein